ncbi:hypothetical protein [Roseisolibacter agri]|uniref:Uncharacterized protein n=1 Tax=Roseisolibacter agri TaxID=2014610 RepID=A0AA37Q390_9BACT|nr:hypothetical protein [Roseisolibacter agri]GLC23797.1 hypothetical protein rosag_03100 [Roseisolibacter agri]
MESIQQQTDVPPERPESRDVASPYLAAVHRAWRDVCTTTEPRSDTLRLALHALARDARARGLGVQSLLKLLDQLTKPRSPADAATPGFDRVREWAGTEVIRAYYGGR